MYGAIIGDIIGSRFEFDRGNKTRDFKLFTSESDFTDDTVMTIAVAEALMDVGPSADETAVKRAVIRSMKKWGKKYPYAGYGARFINWVLTDDPEPYGSYGNGSGMRVSSVGWLYDSLERTREVARWTAEVSHNHPEGIKGAESVAAAIFMARTGASKDEIQDYIEEEFGYDLSRTLDDIRPGYQHVEDCMHTMPEAFECFLEAENYEDCIRNVMYIGGDTDTLGAISGAIAEAKWTVPEDIIVQAKEYLPKEISDVISRFIERVNQNKKGEEPMSEHDMKSGKFDELLMLQNELKDDSFGEVKNPLLEGAKLHKGTREDPIPFPHIEYSEAVHKLIKAVYNFHKANPDYDLFNYMGILNCNGYTDINVNTIDVSEMDDKCLMALFMALIRGERFCDGLILDALEEGAVQRWLERLRTIVSEE